MVNYAILGTLIASMFVLATWSSKNAPAATTGSVDYDDDDDDDF